MSSSHLTLSGRTVHEDEASLFGVICREFEPNLVGEMLRRMTFVGEGFGCYSTFDVRSDAVKWSDRRKEDHWDDWGFTDDPDQGTTYFEAAELGEGYSFKPGEDFQINACWFWDGDGTLTFTVRRGCEVLRRLENTDCKKDYQWRDCMADESAPHELTPEEREALDMLRNRPSPFPEDRETWEAFEAGWVAAGRWRPAEQKDSRDAVLRAFQQWKDERSA